MTDLRQAAQAVLERWDAPVWQSGTIAAAITALRKALEQPEQQAEPLTMQPIVQDKHGVIRFKKNGLVDALYEHGVKTGLGLNELYRMTFTDEDRQQFAQLIGYSVSGYGSLSYVSDEAYEAAEQAPPPPQHDDDGVIDMETHHDAVQPDESDSPI